MQQAHVDARCIGAMEQPAQVAPFPYRKAVKVAGRVAQGQRVRLPGEQNVGAGEGDRVIDAVRISDARHADPAGSRPGLPACCSRSQAALT